MALIVSHDDNLDLKRRPLKPGDPMYHTKEEWERAIEDLNTELEPILKENAMRMAESERLARDMWVGPF